MGLPSALTAQHVKLDANISVMRSYLESTRDADTASAEEALDEIHPRIERVGELLRGYLREEQRTLLPHAERIFGETVEEVSEISERNTELLETFEAFADILQQSDGQTRQIDLEKLRERFEAFLDCFHRQRDAERNFYTLYSTILFPSGASTD